MHQNDYMAILSVVSLKYFMKGGGELNYIDT